MPKLLAIYNIKGTEFLPQILILKSYIFSTWWCKPLIFQTIIIWSKMIDSLKYLRSPTLKCKDIGIRKSEFVTKTQFLCIKLPICILPVPQLKCEKMEKASFLSFLMLLSFTPNFIYFQERVRARGGKFCQQNIHSWLKGPMWTDN